MSQDPTSLLGDSGLTSKGAYRRALGSILTAWPEGWLAGIDVRAHWSGSVAVGDERRAIVTIKRFDWGTW